MPVTNTKNIASRLIIKYFVINALLLIGTSAHAAGTCLSDKSDISEDMSKIHAKLAIKYSKTVYQNNAERDAVLNPIYDKQQLKVDRNDPFLKQVNAVGVITDAPIGSNKSYATALLISPCHILVNAHAVIEKKARQGNAPVYISLGQSSCQSSNEFTYQDISGKVIAIGDNNEDISLIRDSKDYAVIKIQKISDIQLPIVSMDFITINNALVTIGFPYSYTYKQKTSLRYPTANFTRKTAVGIDGTFETANQNELHGSSGSGIFVLDVGEHNEPQLILGAIIVGRAEGQTGGVGLQTAAIIQHLKATNPKVYNEVKTAIQKNNCD